MIPHTYTGGPVATNGYLLDAPGGLLIIDAPEGIIADVLATGKPPLALLLTHQHFDHVQDAAELARMGATIYSHAPFSTDLTLEEGAKRWGMDLTIEPFTVDEVLDGQSSLSVGGLDFDLRHVPGHSPDSIVFSLLEHDLAFAGDTLFADSIGRTDLPGGGHRQLLDAIREQMFSLPPETRVLPGHGPATTIGQEIASNPYLQ